ncbi:polysaccharide deacetylase family protein (plasmid) [Deinococcus taeanensis]|uniref:polysaccharide deacetylase family protein n=1 Tax=Deinococcus taeanensis TaxID=2737050 RepID=UPI001CDD0E8A|nr:polysaccharide deacetylase family protein [Deinococcus taeanensis]UBV44448.1 polysaccharide deacetylase family protein [Deinococcus taeanensis]
MNLFPHSFSRTACLLLPLALGACSAPRTPTNQTSLELPAVTPADGLAAYTLTLTNPGRGALSAQSTPSVALQSAGPSVGAQSAVRLRSSAAGFHDDIAANRRYLWTTFEVVNETRAALDNLTLVAYARAGQSIGGTALTALTGTQGEPAARELVARNIRPGDFLPSLPAPVNSFGFAGLRPEEAQGLERAAQRRGLLEPGDDVLEYGFSVSTPATGSQTLRPGARGTVTVVLKLPLIDARAPEQFSLSLLLATAGTERVTRLIGEPTAQAAERARASGAQELALIGPDRDLAPRKLRTVRLSNIRLSGGATPIHLLDPLEPLTGCLQNLSPQAANPQGTAGPLVTFLSDDGTAADLERLLPLFQEKGAVMTAAVASQNMMSGDAYFASAEQIRALQRAGWEIANHSRTHADLTTLTDTELDAEIEGARRELEAQGLKVTNFVYPYGQQDQRVRKIVCKSHRTAFVDRGGVNPLPMNTNYRITRVALGSWTDAGQNTLEAYKTAVDAAQAKGGWLVFMLHPGNHEQHDATQQAYLAQTIDYIKGRNIPIVTAAEAVRRLSSP